MKIIEEINKSISNNEKFALIFIDIDNFKTFNDSKGHVYGDKLLIEIVKRFKTYVNNNLTIGRYGGDEFILIKKYNENEEVINLINNIYEDFKMPVMVNKEISYIDLSIGVSFYPLHSNNAESLIRKADIAMYKGKKTSKNTYTIYNETINLEFGEEILIKEKIEKALVNDNFKIVLQPQVNIRTNEIVSFEALARFKNENIKPDKFIEIAEKYNLINDLGKVIINKAIYALKTLKENNIKLRTIYVNFSIDQLYDDTLITYILNKLKETNIEPKYLGIEITENVLINESKETITFFEKLKSYGFKLSIDDFGSGNASLSYLISYPLSSVKLDRSFVNKYLNKEYMQIFTTIVYLAKELNYDVLAEGVEKEEQINLLKQTRCNLVQGYYYYKPMDLKDLIEIIKENE